MTNRLIGLNDMARRDVFRVAGTAAIGGLALAALPKGLVRMARATEAHGGAEGAEKLEIELGEMFFRVEGQGEGEPIHLAAGQKYEIEFKNVGAAKHEVMIGREVHAEDGRPHGYETNLFEGVETKFEGHGWEVEATGMKEIELEPGEEVELVFTLPAGKTGEWEIGCFVPGHYEAGMKLPVIVEGAAV